MIARAGLVVAPVAGWLLVAGSVAVAGEAPDVAVARLLTRARTAKDPNDAVAAFAEAEGLLDRVGGRLDALTRGFLRADCLRARGRRAVMDCQRAGGRKSLRQAGRRTLQQAIEQYARLVELCEQRLDALEKRLGQREPRDDPEWRRLRGLISRANYSEAWSCYHLAFVAVDAADRTARLEQAIERFGSFTAREYRKHPILADCYLGQALCHHELGQHFRVLKLLAPVRADNTPPGPFRRMTYVLMQSARAYGSYLAAETAAKRYFDGRGASNELDAVELGMALERAKCLAVLADAKRNPEYHKLFAGRLAAVTDLLYARGEPWRSRLARALSAGAGAGAVASLVRARALFERGEYAAAAGEAARGLSGPASKTTPAALADLRYLRAAAEVNRREPLAAFRAAGEFLRHHPDDRRSAGLARKAILVGRQGLGATPAVGIQEFLGVLASIEKRFGAAGEFADLPWHRGAALLGAGRFAQAAETLTRIAPDSKVYAAAQYGLAMAGAKQAEALARKTGVAAGSVLALRDRSSAAVGRFVAAAEEGTLAEADAARAATVVDVGVSLAERYLDGPSPRPARALAVLDDLDRLKAWHGRAGWARGALRVRARALAGEADAAGTGLAKLLDDPAAADTHNARALAEAVRTLSEAFDRLAGSDAAGAARLGEQIVRARQRVVGKIERSSEPKVRARLGAERLALAEMLRRLGRHVEAVGHYEWLVRNLPKARRAAAIRGLAICHEAARRYGAAAKRWEPLARRLEKNTDGWYEARYHWTWCLYRDGRHEAARRLLAYFRLQNPKIAAAQWRTAFDALARQMGSPTSEPAAGGEGQGTSR